MKRLFCSVIRSERLDTNYCQVQGWKILSSHTFNSPNIPLFEEYGIPVTKKLCSRHVLKMKKGSFHSATQFGSWFLKEISQGARFFAVVNASTKSLNEVHTKFFQPLNYTFMWTSDFYWYEHVYTYRSRQEFQNIFERKLCNCFGQLLLIY